MGRWSRLVALCTLLLTNAVLNAQESYDFGFIRTQQPPVHHDGRLLLFSWTGGINSVSCASFNLNDDSYPDLILFEKHGNRLLTFINNGIDDSCSYTLALEYAQRFPTLHDWVIFRDYDGDGRLDIFTYGNAGITIYHNITIGEQLEFECVTTQLQSEQFGQITNLYASPDDYLAIEDVDGDGDLDILNFWLLGKYVHLHRNYSMENYGDCNHLDFRLEDECWGHFEEGGEDNSILLNSSCGRKSEPTRHVGSTIVVRDLTGNGLPDMVLGDIDYPNLVFLQNGGTLDDALMVAIDTLFPNPEQPVRLYSMPVLSFVDIDNDGVEELLASPSDPVLNKSQDLNSVWGYRINEQSQYEKFTENFLQNEMMDVGSGAAPVFYDWDGDGLADLFIGNYGRYEGSVLVNGFLTSTFVSSITYYHNSGSETEPAFEWVTDDFGGLQQYGLIGLHPAFCDLDGNGTTDLLCGTSDGQVLCFLNLSDNPDTPVFGAPDSDFIGHDFGDFAKPQIFDLDRDGHTDLLVGNRRGRITYFRNTSNTDISNFQFVTDTLGGVDVRDAEISYFGFCAPWFFRNADNETVLFCGSEQGEIFYYQNIDNNLTGTFMRAEVAWSERGTSWHSYNREGLRTVPAVTDLNGDSYPEVVIGNYAGGLTLFVGTEPPAVGIPQYSVAQHPSTLKTFPNPTSGMLTIEAAAPIREITVYDLSGRMIMTINGDGIAAGTQFITTLQYTLSIAFLPNGLYLLKAVTDSGVATGRFVKTGN